MGHDVVHRDMRVINSVSLFAVLSCIAMIGATPVANRPRGDGSKYVSSWLECDNVVDMFLQL
jgi:hypothetical protein